MTKQFTMLPLVVAVGVLTVSCGGGGSSTPGFGTGQVSSSASLTAPGKPQNIRASVNSTQAVLDWNAVNTADSYSLYQRNSSIKDLTDATLVAEGITDISFIVDGLDNGSTYFFVLVAENNAGTSVASDNVAVFVTDVNNKNQFTATLAEEVIAFSPEMASEFYSNAPLISPARIEYEGSSENFRVGAIIVSPSANIENPSVFSRITGLRQEGGNTVLDVEVADLSEAFHSLKSEGSYPLDLSQLPLISDQAEELTFGPIYETGQAPQILKNQCGTNRSYIAKIALANRISGCMALDAHFDFEMEISQEFPLRWRNILTFDVNTYLESGGNLSSNFFIAERVYFDDIELPPLSVGLLSFRNGINFNLGGYFDGSRPLSTGFNSSIRTVVEFEYEDGVWASRAESSPIYTFFPPENYTEFSSSFYTGPIVSSRLYGITGPEVAVRTGVESIGQSWAGGSSISSDFFSQADVNLLSNNSGLSLDNILTLLLGDAGTDTLDALESGFELIRENAFRDEHSSNGGGSSSSPVSGSSSSSSSVASSSFSSSSSSSSSVSSASSTSSSSLSHSSIISSLSSASSSSVNGGSSSSQGGGNNSPNTNNCNVDYDIITSGLPLVLAAIGENDLGMVQIDIPGDQTILSQAFSAPQEGNEFGQFDLAPSSNSIGAIFKVWYSTCAGGDLTSGSIASCSFNDAQGRLRWVTVNSRFYCRLTPGNTYYLNVQVISGGDTCPDEICSAYVQQR